MLDVVVVLRIDTISCGCTLLNDCPPPAACHGMNEYAEPENDLAKVKKGFSVSIKCRLGDFVGHLRDPQHLKETKENEYSIHFLKYLTA